MDVGETGLSHKLLRSSNPTNARDHLARMLQRGFKVFLNLQTKFLKQFKTVVEVLFQDGALQLLRESSTKPSRVQCTPSSSKIPKQHMRVTARIMSKYTTCQSKLTPYYGRRTLALRNGPCS
eukprot:1937945-Amphidinium_carterae.1